MKIEEISIMMRVAYIPCHANGDIHHKDVERGTVRSKNDTYAFVVFDKQRNIIGFEGATAPACNPIDLVHL